MRRRHEAASPQSALRLFLVFAVVSLVPVLVLGLVLAGSYRSNAAARGLAEARTQAGLFGRTSIEPRLAGADLDQPLAAQETAALDQMSSSAVADGDIVRFRIRSLAGRVVYSNDDSESESTDEEALEAARGETVAEVTHLNADEDNDGAVEKGIRVAEVYSPLTNGESAAPVGVLELYLPYDPIARDVESGLHSLYRDLAVGLLLLYLVLAGISWSVTRRLRALAARNGQLATHDQLTGLPNRRSFQDHLADAMAAAERQGDDTVVAILNLDRFTEVNDTLGHRNGDALLVEVGRRLLDAVGQRDFLARLGGDEFAVIFESTAPEAVGEQITAMLETLRDRVELAGIPVEVEATVGLARAPQDGAEPDVLLQHADVAVDAAKHSGMRTADYDAATDPYDPTRLALVGDLRRAIEHDELTLHFQPKLDVRTGVVEAVEALIRWNHPERGLVMPDEFIPVVEQTQMIDPLTAWVLDASLGWVVRARATTPRMRVAVNVSARNLIHAGFPDQVADALGRHGCDADCLAIEVTETAFVADPQRAEASLRRLSDIGVRISLDDFGRGQTSLSQLASMPLDEVKIDKSFVMDMSEVGAHASIVQSVTDLAHRLGFRVVAEGVEHQRILDALGVAGCDTAQGYFIARPMPEAALAEWLAVYAAPQFTRSAGSTDVGGRHRRESDRADVAMQYGLA